MLQLLVVQLVLQLVVLMLHTIHITVMKQLQKGVITVKLHIIYINLMELSRIFWTALNCFEIFLQFFRFFLYFFIFLYLLEYSENILQCSGKIES